MHRKENEMEIPKKTTVLVIGGGPAGSTAAAFLARDGVSVVLAERETFPRYHIGESLLPSCLEILELLGARDVIEREGFQRKPGADLHWKGEEWSLDFGELSGEYHYSFQVQRARFDQLLLQHAQSKGVQVFEATCVRELYFDGERPTSALCIHQGEEFRIDFDYLIDASGRSGIMSTRYLKNRRFHDRFKNVAVWGYWEGARRLPGEREGAIAVGSIPDGWIWAIPFNDGQMSIGAVIQKDAFNAERKKESLIKLYTKAMAQSPFIQQITADGHLASELRVEQDYSYNAAQFAGPGCFLAGDAACFLDPLLSTGAHLAMYSAMLSAACLGSVVRGEVTEREAIQYYEQIYRNAYLRLLVFVSSFYESRGVLGYYEKAEEMSAFDADPANIKRAFLNLVSGLEDFAIAENTTAHLMGEMSKRIRENLELRKDKNALKERADVRHRAGENAKFFGEIEGMSCFSPEKAIDGLYVGVRPQLGLKRVAAGNSLSRGNGSNAT
jgi:flavin-dependent dehydrogenase